ncbi:hypothetical protein [Bacillus timonensis]|uniref:hypothetical protein n=1 Tax=Bacillus timonensis TaxID=1033734 RepID=UPI0003180586|nr:hypothetical protein [Bacillus timonensis]
MDELLSKCWLVKNTFNIDVQIIDEQFKTVFHLSNDNEPLIFVEAREKMYGDIQATLTKAPNNSFCYHTDTYQLSYLVIPLLKKEQFQGMVLFGPFLTEQMTDTIISNVIKKNNLENKWMKPLQNFYQSLAYFGQSYLAVGEMLVNVFHHPHLKSHVVTLKNRTIQHHSEIQPQDYDQTGYDIKLRYDKERMLLHYIEIGDKENAKKAFVEFTGDFLYRFPGNPLRAKKTSPSH